MYKIYIVRNNIDRKIYVGLTSRSAEARWIEHKRDCTRKKHWNIYFYNALRKYGPENFTIKEIDSADSFDMAGNLERVYILMYMSYIPELGYNTTFGGEGGEPTPEVRKKMGQVWKGKKLSVETRRKMSLAKMGHKTSAETVAKISAANTGQKRSEQARKNMSIGQQRRRHGTISVGT